MPDTRSMVLVPVADQLLGFVRYRPMLVGILWGDTTHQDRICVQGATWELAAETFASEARRQARQIHRLPFPATDSIWYGHTWSEAELLAEQMSDGIYNLIVQRRTLFDSLVPTIRVGDEAPFSIPVLA